MNVMNVIKTKDKVRFEMKKMTTVLATGLLALAATAEAGSKCNGTATTNRSVRSM